MGRHADAAGQTRRWRVSIPVVAICLLLIGAAALGVWWWKLKSVTDPIDADPVDAYAVVVSAPDCTGIGADTATVTISGTQPPVTATLNACGYQPGARLAVQYLAGHPEQVRLSGTSTAGPHGMASRLLPLGILAAGLVAVLATISLLVEKRRSRHAAAASRVSVAQLRATQGQTGATQNRRAAQGQPGAAGQRAGWLVPAPAPAPAPAARSAAGRRRAAAERDGVPTTASTGEPDQPVGSDGSSAAPSGVANAHPTGPPETAGTDADADGDPAEAGGAVDINTLPAAEPTHLLPSGFVMMDEQLFTHHGSEAVEPAEPGDG